MTTKLNAAARLVATQRVSAAKVTEYDRQDFSNQLSNAGQEEFESLSVKDQSAAVTLREEQGIRAKDALFEIVDKKKHPEKYKTPDVPNLVGLLKQWDKIVDGQAKSKKDFDKEFDRGVRNLTKPQLMRLEKFAAKTKDQWRDVITEAKGGNRTAKSSFSKADISLLNSFMDYE